MRSLYLRIYLTVVVALALYALVSGWLLQRHLEDQRVRAEGAVRERVEAGQLTLHGWHYVIEDGEVHVFDVQRGGFVPAALADNAGTGPYRWSHHDDLEPAFDASGIPMAC